MPGSSPFDENEYTHDKEPAGELEVMDLHCQFMMALVALTEYKAKIIRIAAEMHDFAPDGAIELLKFYTNTEYNYTQLYELTMTAMQDYAAIRRSEEE